MCGEMANNAAADGDYYNTEVGGGLIADHKVVPVWWPEVALV